MTRVDTYFSIQYSYTDFPNDLINSRLVKQKGDFKSNIIIWLIELISSEAKLVQ